MSKSASEPASMASLRQCDDLPTHIALPISEPVYLVFLCQLVSLLQGQITIDLVDRASHPIVSLLEWQPTQFSNGPSFIHTFYDLALFTT